MSGPDFLNIVAPPEWMADGLCAQVDPELFFPEAGAPNREAKAVCAGCEVRSECLAYALAHRERFGVWGGTTERERRRMRRPVVRRAPGCRRPDKREGVVRQLAATLTDPEIAGRLGCSPRTVLRIRAAAGIPAARPSGDNRVGAA
jgi:WhiB family redox-sensing transcriptional regulator